MDNQTASPSAPTPSAAPSPALNPASAGNERPAAPPENLVKVEGILDIDFVKGGNGQLLDLSRYGKRRPSDTFVPKELIRRFKLKPGQIISGTAYPAEGKFPNPKMKFIETVDGLSLEDRRAKIDFINLTTVSPNQQLKLECGDHLGEHALVALDILGDLRHRLRVVARLLPHRRLVCTRLVRLRRKDADHRVRLLDAAKVLTLSRRDHLCGREGRASR